MSREAAAAADFYRSRLVPERLEQALNSTFYLGPEDVYGHLANYFAGISKPPVISSIRGRKVFDGTGQATLEVQVFCTVRDTKKNICSVMISADSGPVPPLLTCDTVEANEIERKVAVETAIDWIQDYISSSLRGIQPYEQGNVDQILSDYYKVKKEEERAAADLVSPPPSMSALSPPASPLSRKKKGSGKGKQTAALEKPIPPMEPPELATRGSIAVGAVSLGVAKCSAVLGSIPLYSYISTLKHEQPPAELVLPTPLITLLSYGKSSPGKLNLMKEVMLVPKPGLSAQESLNLASSIHTQILKQVNSVCKSGAPLTISDFRSAPELNSTLPAVEEIVCEMSGCESALSRRGNDGCRSSPVSLQQSVTKSVSTLGCLELGSDRLDQPLDLIQEACEHLGLHLASNVFLAINCAAHELMDYNKGKYEVMSGTWKSPDEMVDLYVDFISRHPAVIALVDPLRKEDRQQYLNLGKAVGSRCYILADVASNTIPHLLQAGYTALPSGHVLKCTNETTVSDLLAVVRLIQGEERVSVLGCTHEESSEDSLTDLAVGLGTNFIKLGGLLRGERTAKYNRLLVIEEDLALSGRLGSRSEFRFPTLWKESQCNPPAEEEMDTYS